MNAKQKEEFINLILNTEVGGVFSFKIADTNGEIFVFERLKVSEKEMRDFSNE